MRDTMEIENGSGVIATVRPAFFSPIKHRYEIDLAGGARLEAVGNFADKDWELKDGHHVIGRISRRWFRIRDTYGVEVEQGVDDALIIAIAICIDRIYEDEKREREHHDEAAASAAASSATSDPTAPPNPAAVGRHWPEDTPGGYLPAGCP